MKITTLLADYLHKNKRLNLQGFGFFTLEGSLLHSTENEKDGLPIMPGTVQFHPDHKVALDDELIIFLSKESGKMKPLAMSDLESYLELGKQLVNISKPFVLEGIGTLQKNGQNQLEFIQEVTVSVQSESQGKKQNHPSDEGIHFDDNYLKPAGKIKESNRTILILILILLGLAIIGWVAYYYYNKLNQPDIENSTAITGNTLITGQAADTNTFNAIQDTASSILINKDSIPPVINTSSAVAQDSFNLVLEIANRNRALKRFADLKEWGHHVQIKTKDSIQYILYIPVHAPVSDSSRHRDSLSRFFGRKVWVETK